MKINDLIKDGLSQENVATQNTQESQKGTTNTRKAVALKQNNISFNESAEKLNKIEIKYVLKPKIPG